MPVRPPIHDVCVVGSANLDLVVNASRLPVAGETVVGYDYHEYPGGKGLNQAVAAARSGASTCFVGAVGDDDAGRRLRTVLTDDGVDTEALVVATAATGRALITVADGGENSIVVAPGANALVDGLPLPPSRVVLAQLEIPLAAVRAAFEAARRAGSSTVLNPAPGGPLPLELLALCDIVVPNEGEAAALGGVAAILACGVPTVLVTRGASGVDVVTASGTRHHDAIPVAPVDTTGAGDTFCGYLAGGLARHHSLDRALAEAIAAAALSTTRHGASPSIPSAREVDEFMTSR